MKKEDIISIIVPIYNVEEYVDECIQSILKQSYKFLEIILVDDGSTDSSGQICDRYAQQDSRVCVIHKKNEGLVSARKAGLMVAKGQYIGFVDGDDYIDCNMYLDLWKELKKSKSEFIDSGYWDAGMIYGHFEKHFEEVSGDLQTVSFLKKYFFGIKGHPVMSTTVWSKLYKAEFIKECYKGVPDTQNLCEDVVSLLECIFRCHQISFFDKERYHYRIRKDSLAHSRKLEDLISLSDLFRVLKNKLSKRGYLNELEDLFDNWALERYWNYLTQMRDSEMLICRYAFKDVNKVRNKKIVIYGAGVVGKSYYAQLCRYPDCQIVAWVDENYRNISLEYYEVLGKDILKTKGFDYLIIAVLNSNVAERIKCELIEDGIEKNKIIWVLPQNMARIVKNER